MWRRRAESTFLFPTYLGRSKETARRVQKPLCDKLQDMLHYAMIEKFVATLRKALRKVELNATFSNDFCNLPRNILAPARYVTLGNVSFNLYHHGTTRQVARKIAHSLQFRACRNYLPQGVEKSCQYNSPE